MDECPRNGVSPHVQPKSMIIRGGVRLIRAGTSDWVQTLGISMASGRIIREQIIQVQRHNDQGGHVNIGPTPHLLRLPTYPSRAKIHHTVNVQCLNPND